MTKSCIRTLVTGYPEAPKRATRAPGHPLLPSPGALDSISVINWIAKLPGGFPPRKLLIPHSAEMLLHLRPA